MPVSVTDSDGITTIHIAERLEINLLAVDEVSDKMITDMELQVYFNVITKLASGKEVGQKYWDKKPLKLDCKNNPQVAEAMRVIQQAIGAGRYAQITAPAPEPVESPGMIHPV